MIYVTNENYEYYYAAAYTLIEIQKPLNEYTTK